MRVAVVSDYLPGYHSKWSGAELIAVTLSEMLVSEGCEVFFLTTPFDFTCESPCDAYPVKTPLKGLGPLSRNFPLDIKAIAHVYRALKDKRPDIVHINAKYLFIPAMVASMALGIPAVFTVPDYFILCPTSFIRKPDGRECAEYHGGGCRECIQVLGEGRLKRISRLLPGVFLRWLLALRSLEFDYLLKKMSAYVVLSEASKLRLIDYGIPEEKIRPIYHYRPASPADTQEPIESPSAAFAGWLSEENGTDLLVRAFAATKKKIGEARLYLVGEGKKSFVSGLKDEARRLGVSDSVLFLGKRGNGEALSILSKADVAVVPHQWPKEFGPVVLVEALALGKPVITSDIGATSEFVANGKNGFLVKEYGSPEAFAEKLTLLLRDARLAKKMGEAARRSVSFLFDGSSSEKMMGLYMGLVGKETAVGQRP